MKYDIKRITQRAFLIYSLINVFAYAFTHVAYLFYNDTVGEIFEYVSYYFSKSAEFLAPPVIAAIAYMIYREHGIKRAILSTLAIASARAFYSLPYYYITFIYNYFYDSVESILLSLAVSVLVVLATALSAAVSICIYMLVLRIICKRSGNDISTELATPLERTNIFDFLAKGNLPVLAFALTQFVFNLILELVDTVAFFIEYSSDFRPSEIITILVNFTLLFILLVASYLIASVIKNKLVADKECDQAAE